MKFRVERDALAEAVAWAARSVSTRPTIPVLAGLLLTVDDARLSISGFDLEASTQVDLDVAAGSPGSALVSGRLLADISRALPPHPVEVAVDGARLTISCGSARFTLPTMPVEDYPTLPSMPTTAGTVDGETFAAAVAQVAVAAGRDDTLPMLTGVRLEIDGDRLTLAATDRYRLAVRELGWQPSSPTAAAGRRAGTSAHVGRLGEKPCAQRCFDDRVVSTGIGRQPWRRNHRFFREFQPAAPVGPRRACWTRSSRRIGPCFQRSGRRPPRFRSHRSSKLSSGLRSSLNVAHRSDWNSRRAVSVLPPVARTRAEPRRPWRSTTKASR